MEKDKEEELMMNLIYAEEMAVKAQYFTNPKSSSRGHCVGDCGCNYLDFRKV